jgi:hypothetical protein
MAAGEPVVSQASTDEYRAAHDRIFGDKPAERGRWVLDPETKTLVRAEDYVPPPAKTGTGIMCDRWMEGTATLDDGTDIGSRRKRERYMRERGVTDASDFSPNWYARLNAERRREAKKGRREALERAMHKIDPP